MWWPPVSFTMSCDLRSLQFPATITLHVNCTGKVLFVANHEEPETCDSEPHLTFENQEGKPGMVKGSLYTLAVVDPDWCVGTGGRTYGGRVSGWAGGRRAVQT